MQRKLDESETLGQQRKILVDKLSTRVEQQEERVAMVTEERSTGMGQMQENVEKLAEQVFDMIRLQWLQCIFAILIESEFFIFERHYEP